MSSIFSLKGKPGRDSSPGKTLAKTEKHHPMNVLYTPVVTMCLKECNNVGKSLFAFMLDDETDNTLISVP